MKTRGRLTVVLLLLMGLLPTSLVGQSAEGRIRGALDRALEAGIPIDLIQNKVDEGMAKGVAMDAIADAVQQRLDGLLRAQDALMNIPDVDAADLSVAADALGEGVSETVLRAVAESEPRERRAVAIYALMYLWEQGIQPEQALERVRAALARGSEALQNLPAQARGPNSLESPSGQIGPPAEIPAPGEPPGQGRPQTTGPARDLPAPPDPAGPGAQPGNPVFPDGAPG